jgi:hypothetical protein
MVTDWGYSNGVNWFIAIVGSLILLGYCALHLWALGWLLFSKHLSKKPEYQFYVRLWFLHCLLIGIGICIATSKDFMGNDIFYTLILQHDMPPIRHVVVWVLSLLMIGLYVAYVRKLKLLLDRESK